MTTDIEGGSAHVYCCGDFDDGVNGNSCVGVNDCDCVDIGDIIGACLVDNMRTSGVSFHQAATHCYLPGLKSIICREK